jgi:hypothetical protein
MCWFDLPLHSANLVLEAKAHHLAFRAHPKAKLDAGGFSFRSQVH